MFESKRLPAATGGQQASGLVAATMHSGEDSGLWSKLRKHANFLSLSLSSSSSSARASSRDLSNGSEIDKDRAALKYKIYEEENKKQRIKEIIRRDLLFESTFKNARQGNLHRTPAARRYCFPTPLILSPFSCLVIVLFVFVKKETFLLVLVLYWYFLFFYTLKVQEALWKIQRHLCLHSVWRRWRGRGEGREGEERGWQH